MRFRLLTAVLTILIGIAPAFALTLDGQEGDASFGFLKFSLSPRSIALGGAGMALVDGVADVDLNPAAAARDSGGIALGQGYLPFGSKANYVSWNIPWKDQRITVQARYLGEENIPGWSDLPFRSTAAYGAHTLKLQAGTAGNVLGFAYGVSAAYAQNNIADVTYETGLLNAGLWHELPAGFSTGVSVLNADFWTTNGRDGSKIIPPTAVQAGLAYTRNIPGHTRLSLAVDARKRNDEKLAIPVGVEACWQNLLSVRAGYPFQEPEASPAFGLGLHWSRYGFDYEYQGNAELSGAHFWALEVSY